MNLSERYLSKG